MMATPSPEMIKICYASENLGSDGKSVTRTAGSGGNALSFSVTNISEATGFWNGALGFFTNTVTSALRGQTFHVRSWNKETETLTLASPLPATPVQGETFVLFVRGKQASSQEVLCMKVGGKQPEIETVTGTSVTGVTIKKVSPILGEGTLSISYTNANNVKALQIRKGTSGNFGPMVEITRDMTSVVLYAPDMVGYIIVDVEFAKLSTAARTENFTVTAPQGSMIPNFEGYETNDGVGRSRYHLFVIKNTAADSQHAISGMLLWTGKPAGGETTCSSSYSPSYTAAQAITVANATGWPTRGFWVRNRTANSGAGDLRYVDYRSGNVLYTKPIVWGRVPFKDGKVEIKPGATIMNGSNSSYTAVVDQVNLTSGTWEDGTAAGELILKKWLTNFSFASNAAITVDGIQAATASAASTRGHRGHLAATWSSGNIIELASDIDIGIEIPGEDGLFSNIETENVAPQNVLFGTHDAQLDSMFAGPVFAGGMIGIWIRQTILDGTQAREKVEGDLSLEWY